MSVTLTTQEIEDFGREMRDLYEETKAKLGPEDLRVAERYDTISKSFEILGRSLIQSGGPLGWAAGVGLLGTHYTIEFSQGHNILHGQYDEIPGDHKFRSETWRWDNTMDEEDWKFEHHVVHHPFTNIIGVDHDFGFLLYRANYEQEWKPHHLLQVPIVLLQPVITSLFFPWYVSTSRAKAEDRELMTWQTYGPTLKNIGKYFLKNFLFFPALAGPAFPKVMLGNALAKILSNYHLQFILGTSHLAEGPEVYFDNQDETEAEFFLRQTLATVNYQTPDFLDVVYGGINYHLEHHLFPDLPPNRLKEISPRVREICAKYGIPYQTDSFFNQSVSLVSNVLKNSLPNRPEDKNKPWYHLLTDPAELATRVIQSLDGALQLGDQNRTGMTYESRVLDKQVLATDPATGEPEVVWFRLTRPKNWHRDHWDGGAYISLQFEINGETLTRQYSLIKPSSYGTDLEIAVRRVSGGQVSAYLQDKIRIGDTLRILGQAKSDFRLAAAHDKALFIAAGVGITPIISMLRDLRNRSPRTPARLLYFNRSAPSTVFKAELDNLAASPGMNLVVDYFVSREEEPAAPFQPGRFDKDGKLLDKIAEDLSDHDIYICAPEGFITSCRAALEERGVPAGKIHFEDFTPAGAAVDETRSNIFHEVEFTKSGKKITINENTTLLAAIEQSGIAIPTGCRKGVCKACQVRKVDGKTQLEEEKGVSQTFITSCNSQPRGPVKIAL